MTYPWNADAATAIGADWLLAEIAPSGTFGRDARARERVYRRGDGDAARAALERVMQIARDVPSARIAELREAVASAPDIREALVRARAGATLDDVDFFEIARFLDALAALAIPTRDAAFAPLHVLPEPMLREMLAPGRTVGRTFYLDDAFAPELESRRRVAATAQAAFDSTYSKFVARVAAALGRETIAGDAFTVMRDAMPAALPIGARVVRESPTYVLCELELDADALAAAGARDLAADVVADAEEEVRVRLTAAIVRAARALDAACDTLGDLDALLARVAFAQKYACVVPELVDAPTIVLDAMRFVPLEEALARRGRRYAPLSLELASVGVVTGPNMGGKTAALRAVGFALACVALGVPVPARAATLPLVDEIVWLGIGALPHDDALLSAFGQEVVDLRAFLERGSARALVLLDEFARTTSPREGRALAIALIETLRARGAVGLAATHLGGIAAAAHAPHYALGGSRELPLPVGTTLDLDVAIARIASATDYTLARVDEGAEPTADALALAGALGLDSVLLARARQVL